MNIAHAGRTECYCLPADVLLPLMYDLMSGRLGPAEKSAAGEKKPADAKPAETTPADAKPEKKETKRPAEAIVTPPTNSDSSWPG